MFKSCSARGQLRSQIHCRNRHGTHRRGKKVTGLSFIETSRLHGEWQADKSVRSSASREALASEGAGARANRDSRAIGNRQLGMGKANNMSAQYSLLSTTNDSRLRIYDLDNYTMVRLIVPGVSSCGSCRSVTPSRYIFLVYVDQSSGIRSFRLSGEPLTCRSVRNQFSSPFVTCGYGAGSIW